jgi:hypothetical protein
MTEDGENSSFSNSQNDDHDFPTELSREPLAEKIVQTNLISNGLLLSPSNHVSFEALAPSTSIAHVHEQKPWRGGSPSRDSVLGRALPFTPRSPSKKCYGAPELSTSLRNSKADEKKKSLEELRRVTKFPMVCFPSWLSQKAKSRST